MVGYTQACQVVEILQKQPSFLKYYSQQINCVFIIKRVVQFVCFGGFFQGCFDFLLFCCMLII